MKYKKRMFSSATGLFLFWFCLMSPGINYALENSECLDCHVDETLVRSGEKDFNDSSMKANLYVDENKFNHSIHNINGITCVDCHTDIKELNCNQEVPHPKYLKKVECSTCHQAEGDAFVHSVHMEARGKGIVMQCYACHDYHYTSHLESASVAERENGFCLRCHNPYQEHNWLPQKQAHFSFVECTVCHAPAAPRHVHLRFYDLVTNTFLTGDKIVKTLGVGYDEFYKTVDKNNDGVIDNDEIEELFILLRQKDVHIIFRAELVSEMQAIVHQVQKGGAIKDCQQCHVQDAPIFDAVTIVLNKDDGSIEHYKVNRSVLESYHTSHFSALGGTRVRFVDKIGLTIIFGGIAVVLIHLGVRVVTIPARRKKSKKEQ
ncbi:cytochrome c3 family protein [Thiovibrio frasassiensis]|uniref:Cytochrome c3 family protein n=1 Tax=Thiovibrio frasassiensis TaxID=2984131 RepID=A0A9X4MEW2_9BACT|nr:cytochrome c3 family protein [Thiovibrio frasassiensis]MDG4474978.1 cytochrome c3 family protein [Thiovibrio frasassiensis]